MAEVIWSRAALREVAEIVAYTSGFRPVAAERMGKRLLTAGDGLADYPERGRPVGRYRELTVIKPYVIRYILTGERVDILRVRHGARRPLRAG